MPASHIVAAARQRNVHGVGREFLFEGCGLQGFAPCINAALDFLLGFVDFLAGGRALIDWQLTQRLQSRRQLAFLTR